MSAKGLCPDPTRLHGLLAGGLPAGEQADLERHLEGCPACQRACGTWQVHVPDWL